MNKSIIITVFIFNTLFSLNLLAWNTGHNDVQKMINTNLPDNIRSKFSDKQIEKLEKVYSHYPDSFDQFTQKEVGDYGIKLLKKLKIKNKYDLHHPKGILASFILLTESFKKKDYDRSIIWIGALGHALSDEVAVNHDPLVHYITYHLWTYKLKTEKEIKLKKLSRWFDLTNSAKDQQGGKLFTEALKNYTPSIISETVEGVMPGILLKTFYIYPAYGAERSSTLVQQAHEGVIKNNSKSKMQLMETMRDLASLSAKDTLDLITTAYHFSKQNTNMEIDHKKLLKDFDKTLIDSYKKKPFSCEIYKRFMEQSSDKGKVGIIVEPFYRFDKGLLSPLWRYLAPALAIACEKRNIAYKALDARDIYDNGFPNPEDVPVCILDVGHFNSFMWMNRVAFGKKAKSYVEKGGKIIWIGGNISDALGLNKYLKRSDLKKSNYSGISKKDIARAKLIINKNFSKQLEGEYSFINSPETKEGWCKPYSNYKIFNCKEPFMQLKLNDEKIVVSGRFGNIIFIPEYAISPYLINNKYNISKLEKPSLDKFSEEILIQAINKLK